MEQTKENIQKYLEEVAKLESSVYEQKRCCDYAQKNVVLRFPKQKEYKTPVLKKAFIPPYPHFEDVNSLWGKTITMLIFVSLGILALGFGIANIGIFLIVLGACTLVVTLPILIFFLTHLIPEIKANREAVTEYKKKVAEAPLLNEQYQKEYDQEVEAYLVTLEDHEKQYEIEKMMSIIVFSKAQETVQMMVSAYDNSLETLEKIYAYDVIFPKYRNMAAVFTMLEYFQTGRCTELTGPDGAYNLYESELRQNLIINKLDTIIDKLDQIKDNQFLLYSEMTKVNKNLNKISAETQELLDTTKQVEANTQLIAHFSAITAQNTTALTMIAALS